MRECADSPHQRRPRSPAQAKRALESGIASAILRGGDDEVIVVLALFDIGIGHVRGKEAVGMQKCPSLSMNKCHAGVMPRR